MAHVTTRVNSGSSGTSNGSSRNNSGSSGNISGSSLTNSGSPRNNSGFAWNISESSQTSSGSSSNDSGSSWNISEWIGGSSGNNSGSSQTNSGPSWNIGGSSRNNSGSSWNIGGSPWNIGGSSGNNSGFTFSFTIGGSSGNNSGFNFTIGGSSGNNSGSSWNIGGSSGNNSGSFWNIGGSSGNNSGSFWNIGGSSGNNSGSFWNIGGSSGNNSGSSGNNSGSSQTNRRSSRRATQRRRMSHRGLCFALQVHAWSRFPFMRRLLRHRRYFSQTVQGFRKDNLDNFAVDLDSTAPQNSDRPKTLSEERPGAGAKERSEATETQAVERSSTNPAGLSKEEEDHDKRCAVCLDYFQRPTQLKLCGHVFCRACLERSFNMFARCPLCNQVLTVASGNMPDGTMKVQWMTSCLPGYEDHGTIVITYTIPKWIRGENHYIPGDLVGMRREAYLPDNSEGRLVCRLLWVAFMYRLTFCLGYSSIYFQRLCSMIRPFWNIPHKKLHGYPDPDYLTLVREDLAAKGITPEFIKTCRIPF